LYIIVYSLKLLLLLLLMILTSGGDEEGGDQGFLRLYEQSDDSFVEGILVFVQPSADVVGYL